MPAISIDWGAWSQIGAAAQRTEQLQAQLGAEPGADVRPPRRGDPAGGLDAIRDDRQLVDAVKADVVPAKLPGSYKAHDVSPRATDD